MSPSNKVSIKNYYTHISHTTWQCSICQQHVKAASTSNLVQHMKKHPEVLDEFNQKKGSAATPSPRQKRIKIEPLGDVDPLAKTGSNRKSAAEFRKSLMDDADFEWPLPPEGVKEDGVKEEAQEQQEEEETDQEQDEDSHELSYEVTRNVKVDKPTQITQGRAFKTAGKAKESPKGKQEEKPAPDTNNEDPLKMFFETMYKTVQQFPQEEIFQVRRKIFKVVCDSEERLHMKQ